MAGAALLCAWPDRLWSAGERSKLSEAWMLLPAWTEVCQQRPLLLFLSALCPPKAWLTWEEQSVSGRVLICRAPPAFSCAHRKLYNEM